MAFLDLFKRKAKDEEEPIPNLFLPDPTPPPKPPKEGEEKSRITSAQFGIDQALLLSSPNKKKSLTQLKGFESKLLKGLPKVRDEEVEGQANLLVGTLHGARQAQEDVTQAGLGDPNLIPKLFERWQAGTERTGKVGLASIFGTGESLLGALEWQGIEKFKPVREKLSDWREMAAPPQSDSKVIQFADALASGGFSAVSFFLPAAGIMKGAQLFTKVSPAAALLLGNTLNTVLESSVEAGDVYLQAKEQGMSTEEAETAANRDFWVNVVTIWATNRLGIFNSNETRSIKTALLKTAGSEAFQEFIQQAEANIQLGKPALEGAGTAAIVGGIIGPVAGGIISMSGARGAGGGTEVKLPRESVQEKLTAAQVTDETLLSDVDSVEAARVKRMEALKTGKTDKVLISELRIDQKQLDVAIEDVRRGEVSKSLAPIKISVTGKDILLINGHHRVAQALAKGDTSITARDISLPDLGITKKAAPAEKVAPVKKAAPAIPQPQPPTLLERRKEPKPAKAEAKKLEILLPKKGSVKPGTPIQEAEALFFAREGQSTQAVSKVAERRGITDTTAIDALSGKLSTKLDQLSKQGKVKARVEEGVTIFEPTAKIEAVVPEEIVPLAPKGKTLEALKRGVTELGEKRNILRAQRDLLPNLSRLSEEELNDINKAKEFGFDTTQELKAAKAQREKTVIDLKKTDQEFSRAKKAARLEFRKITPKAAARQKIRAKKRARFSEKQLAEIQKRAERKFKAKKLPAEFRKQIVDMARKFGVKGAPDAKGFTVEEVNKLEAFLEKNSPEEFVGEQTTFETKNLIPNEIFAQLRAIAKKGDKISVEDVEVIKEMQALLESVGELRQKLKFKFNREKAKAQADKLRVNIGKQKGELTHETKDSFWEDAKGTSKELGMKTRNYLQGLNSIEKDLYGGEWVQFFHAPVDEAAGKAFDTAETEAYEFLADIATLIEKEGVDMNDKNWQRNDIFQRIVTTGIKEQPDGADRLASMGINPKKIPKLNANQREILNTMREFADRDFDQVQAVYAERTGKILERVKNYLPWWRDKADFDFIGTNADIDPRQRQEALFSQEIPIKGKKLSSPFTKRRKPGAKAKLRVDMIDVLIENHKRKQLYIEMQPVLDDQVAVLRDSELQEAMDPIQLEWLNDQLEIIANFGFNPNAGRPSRLDNMIRKGRYSMAKALFGFRIQTYLKQFLAGPAAGAYASQIMNDPGMVSAATKNIPKALRTKTGFTKKALEESTALRRRRGGEEVLRNISKQGLATNFKLLNWIDENALKPLLASDLSTAAAVTTGIRDRLISEHGFPKDKAQALANRIMKITQSSGEFFDRPQVYAETELMRGLFSFQQFVLGDWWNVYDLGVVAVFSPEKLGTKQRITKKDLLPTKDVSDTEISLDDIPDATNWQRRSLGLMVLLAFVLNAKAEEFVNLISSSNKKIFDTRLRRFLNPAYIPLTLFDRIPILGSFISSAFLGFDSQTHPVFSAVQQMFNHVARIFTAKRIDTKLANAFKAALDPIKLFAPAGKQLTDLPSQLMLWGMLAPDILDFMENDTTIDSSMDNKIKRLNDHLTERINDPAFSERLQKSLERLDNSL